MMTSQVDTETDHSMIDTNPVHKLDVASSDGVSHLFADRIRLLNQ